jgi:signal transduction histidine kinase/CheY-like chemotaxis protein
MLAQADFASHSIAAMTGSLSPLHLAAAPGSGQMGRGISMKGYLVALAVVVTVSLAGMMALTLYSEFQNSLVQEHARLVTLSRLIANNTSVLLQRNRERLVGIGKRPEVLAMDPARCGELFPDLRLMFPEFANLATVDLTGLAPCSAVPQPGGKPVSVAKTEWFQRAMIEKRFIVGKPFLGPITGKMVAVLVEPVWGPGKDLRGFLGLPLDLERFNPRVPEGSLPDGARFGFISSDGILIWRNADEEKLIGKFVGDQTGPKLALQIRDGEAETIGTDNISRYYAFASIPEADWVAFVGVPSDVIVNKVLRTAERNVMIAAVALVIIGILVWFLTRRIDVAERDLLRARDSAEAANRAKSVFLANMSHELRTPLNAILGFAELMAHDESTSDEQRHNLETISRSGRHLLTLINDILEISKIEAGRLVLQTAPCDLHELLDTVVEAMELRAHQRGLEVGLHAAEAVPRYVKTDPGKLRQILINLLANAVKFTEHGGVDLHVDVVGEPGREAAALPLRFAVRDTGPGIASDELDRIFQPFYQTALGARSGEGTGLGLTIARQYAELLGGQLSAVSTLGKGSEFILRLPVTVAEEAIPEAPPRRVVGIADGQPAWRVLIVEDKPDNQRLLGQLMQRVGFDPRIADNGEAAVAAFTSWHPDFIWMDMRMPVMDGYEATRQIRALPGGRLVKIAALTASAFREDREGILAAGCDDVLAKPIDEEKLYGIMERLLGVRFVYAETGAGAANALQALDLSCLPVDLRHELSHAARQLDVEATAALIDRIRLIDAALAGQLAALAAQFRFDRIAAVSEGTGRPS